MGYVSSLEGTTCKSFWTYRSRNFPSWRVSPVSLPSLSVIFTSFVQRRALRRKEVRQASPPRCQTRSGCIPRYFARKMGWKSKAVVHFMPKGWSLFISDFNIMVPKKIENLKHTLRVLGQLLGERFN